MVLNPKHFASDEFGFCVAKQIIQLIEKGKLGTQLYRSFGRVWENLSLA
jgi:hypothetical protein